MTSPRIEDTMEVLKKAIELNNLALGMLESQNLFHIEPAACKQCGERTVKAYKRTVNRISPGWYCPICKTFQNKPYLPDFPWEGPIPDERLAGAGFVKFEEAKLDEKKEENT